MTTASMIVEGALDHTASTMSSLEKMVDERQLKTRKVVDHMVLFKMKDDFTEEQEKEMLESLFTLQYQVKGILALSVGPVLSKTAEGVTHALFERFPSKEDVEMYMQHPQRQRIAHDLVIPFGNGLMMLDYEAEVEDDIEAIFRRGNVGSTLEIGLEVKACKSKLDSVGRITDDDKSRLWQTYSEGIDHTVFIKVKEGTSQASIDLMLQSIRDLPKELGPSTVVQLTAGTNFSPLGKGYTHGFVARVPSESALEYLIKHPAYVEALSGEKLPAGTEFISADLPIASSGSSVTLHG